MKIALRQFVTRRENMEKIRNFESKVARILISKGEEVKRKSVWGFKKSVKDRILMRIESIF